MHTASQQWSLLLTSQPMCCPPRFTNQSPVQLKSVYSGYYVSERGTLVFDQLTWFAVAERLEREKAVMVEERDKFQQQLSSQQVRRRRCRRRGAGGRRGEAEEHEGQEEGQETNGGF